MKRFLTRPVTVVVALSALCLTTVLLWTTAENVIAFPRGHHMMGGPGGDFTMGGPLKGLIHMMDELDLSTEQRDAIGEIMDDRLPKARKLGFAMFESSQDAQRDGESG